MNSLCHFEFGGLEPRCSALERPTLRRSCLDAERPTAQLFAVHRAQRFRAVHLASHFDEPEAARATVEAIANDLRAFHSAHFCEGFAQISVAKRKTQIAYKQSHSHRFTVFG
jgi:hypothetical protein